MNKVILMGRLTSDPVLKVTQSGVGVCSFTVAVNRRFKKDETNFINCVAWRQTAEFITNYFKKGSMIGIIGSIQTRSWEAPSGEKRYATEVLVDEAYFTESKKSDNWGKPEIDPTDFTEPVDDPNLPF